MKLRRRALVLALSIGFAVPLLSVAQAPAPKLVAPNIPFEKYTLPNGLEVILSEDHTLPVVSVDVWFHVGAANERAGRTGFAHLFEHMMFAGSGHVPNRAADRLLQGAGAGEVNGSTSFDRTNYFETVPSNQLALGLWLESDRMGFLLDTVDREKLGIQRDVVRNERRQRTESVPYGMGFETLFHALLPKEHPYYGVVMGSHADIEAARIGDIRDFFKQYYAPNNATLTLVGDFKKSEAKAMIEKYFGPLQRGAEPAPASAVTPEITTERDVTLTDRVQLPALLVGWITPASLAPGDAEMDLISAIVGGGKSSRMYQELVYKQQIAQAASCFQQSMHLTSVFGCQLIARPGVKPEQLQAAADKVFADFIANGPTNEELSRARTESEASLIRPLEDVQSVAETLQQYNQAKGDPGYLPKDLARYETATKASVMEAAKQYLVPNKRAVVTIIAGDKKLQDVPQSPADTDKDFKFDKEYTPEFYASQKFRDNPPPAGPTPKVNLPVPVTFTLSNGLKVLVTERHKVPLISVALVANAGSAQNPVAKPGLAGFTASILSEGTTTRTSTQIANLSADLGAMLGASAATETAEVSLSTLTNTSTQAMELFADVAQHPAFDAKEIERVRARRKTSILQSSEEPGAVASKVGIRALYGADSPYGYPASGTADSTVATTRDDLAGFYNSHYGPKNAVLVFAGDITVPQAREMANKYFGTWNSAAPTAPAVAANGNPLSHRILVVDKPGSPQTAVIVMQRGPSRATPDYPAIQVMNTSLGGSFSSRINLNLREDHGYTYGAFTQFAYRRMTGYFVASSDIRSDVTVPAVKELIGELNKIHTTPLTPDELKRSKDSAIYSLPGQFQTNAALASAMAQLWIYNLPLDYFGKLPAQFEAVTSAQAVEAATKYVRPDESVIVTVGDKAAIETGLKDLKLAPVEEWTTDAEPKK